MSENTIPAGQQPPGQVPPAANTPGNSPGQQTAPAVAVPPPAPPAPAAPVEIVVTLPKDAVVRPEVLKEFTSIMGDPKLSPSQRAQAVVDLQLRQAQTIQKEDMDAYEAYRRGNEEALKKDPVFGKDFEANKVIAQRPLLAFKSGMALAKDLAARGMENSPAVVKFLHEIGSSMGEDHTNRPNPQASESSDEQEKLYQRYPSMRPKGDST